MKIGSHSLSLPLIQGGMGVGVSLSSLAGNVAKKGAMGVISTAQIGFKKPSFLKDTKKANLEAIDEEIKRAKEISNNNGMVAVNVLPSPVRISGILPSCKTIPPSNCT